MDRDRWRRIEQLYQSAVDLHAEERDKFLAQECREDGELRREVESLLKQHDSGGERLLDAPAVYAAGSLLEDTSTSGLAAGTQLGPYQLVGMLGIGGMGRVYQARDSRLGRFVAIKFSHERFTQRFEREAHTIARLNHPNICTLHDVGPNYLVMESIEGETLAKKISQGPLPIPEVIDFVQQITQGLRFAHNKGVLHRDIKPANIMVTPEGHVKIMDFGLAKLGHSPAEREDRTDTMGLTGPGAVIGTAAYLSPEQAKGKPADQQSDIWSLGVVIYEMLTGARPFTSDNSLALLRSITDDEPRSVSSLRPDCPPGLDSIVHKALAKDRVRRYRDASALLLDLEALRSRPSAGRKHLPLMYAAGGVLALAAMIVFLASKRTATQPGPLRMEPITAFPDSATQPSLSADGRMLTFIRGPETFVTSGQIYVKLMPAGDPVQLTDDSERKMYPVFSSDGSRVAYTALGPTGMQSWNTWVVRVLGDKPRLWLPNATGLSWIAPDRLLFSEIKTGMHMAVVSAAESRADSRDVYVPEHVRGMAHRSYLSPDGQSVLLAEMDDASWLPCRVVPFDGKSSGRPVGPLKGGCTYAAWSPDGRWMYFSSNATGDFQLWRQRFPDGVPDQLTFGPTTAEGIALAPDGRSLITSLGFSQKSVWLHDADGKELQISSEGSASMPAWGDGFPRSVFSSGGHALYYLRKAGAERGFSAGELWVYDRSSGSSERVFAGISVTTFDLSPDGKQVVFASIESGGKSRIWIAPLNRRSAPRVLPLPEAYGPVFSSDQEIIYRAPENGQQYIYELKLDSGQVRKAIPEPAINSPAISADREWIVSRTPVNDDDRMGIVKAYPKRDGKPMVVCEACLLRWTSDGKSLLISDKGRIWSIPLPRGKSFPPLAPDGLNFSELGRIPGARAIKEDAVFPGVSDSVYAFEKDSVQRNLYRIWMP